MNASSRTSDFIGNLCLALVHDWEPERLFMALVMTGYFDESGTHDESEVTVMGGALATARQWQRFDKGFARAKKKHGFSVFHTKKFKKKQGDFKGWTNDQCLALAAELAPLTSSFTEGVVASLENAAYENEYKGGDIPRKARPDTKYGLCFRMCLYHFAREALRREHKGKLPEIHVVLESGHPNSGDAERIFRETKADLDRVGCRVLKTITKAEKDECDPLMIADFIAHMTFVRESKVLAGHPRRELAPAPSGQTGLTHLRFDPGGLAEARERMIGYYTTRKKRRH